MGHPATGQSLVTPSHQNLVSHPNVFGFTTASRADLQLVLGAEALMDEQFRCGNFEFGNEAVANGDGVIFFGPERAVRQSPALTLLAR